MIDILLEVSKLPDGGLLLTRDSIILNMMFTETEFAITYLPKNNHITPYIESIDIKSIDVSMSSFDMWKKFIPHEFRKKSHYKFKS